MSLKVLVDSSAVQSLTAVDFNFSETNPSENTNLRAAERVQAVLDVMGPDGESIRAKFRIPGAASGEVPSDEAVVDLLHKLMKFKAA